MDTSPRFALPMIIAAQAQKHLTHNEALAQLETLVQPVVQDMAALSPPTAPDDAMCVIVGPSATGAFAGKDDTIAAWIADAWHFHTPQPGWMVVNAGDSQAHIFGIDGWVPLNQALVQDNLTQVGINATASLSNRLSVASDASLFTAEANDHRLTINKTAATDTASMVFQSGWSGRAEMGLAGHDGFTIKVSADGATWFESLATDPASGIVSMPLRPVAKAVLTGGSRSFAANASVGFDSLEIDQGDVALNASDALVVPADGTYYLGLTLKATSLGAVRIVSNGVASVLGFDADFTGSTGRSISVSTIAALAKDDALTLVFDDAATCLCSIEATYLDLVRL